MQIIWSIIYTSQAKTKSRLSTSADIEKYDLDLAERVCSPMPFISATFNKN